MKIGILDSEIAKDSIIRRDEDRIQQKEMMLSHGEKCAEILIKYGIDIQIISEKILDANGIGSITDLPNGLEKCYLCGTRIVNISFGTTHFLDKEFIRKIVNHYANQGMIIIAASSNDGYTSYPASFSNVIGVSAGDIFDTNIDMCIQKGIDFFAPPGHEIEMEGVSFFVDKGNSFAAPYVTAMVGNLIEKKGFMTIDKIRRELSKKINMFLYAPDWIETAWVSPKYQGREAMFYFEVDTRNLQTCINDVDTIVLCNKEEFNSYFSFGKHIVYLGRDNLNICEYEYHFWSSNVQKNRIMLSKEKTGIMDVPIAYFFYETDVDIISFLVVMKKQFADEGYNAFVGCDSIDSGLYDLEYLPQEDVNKDKIEDYIYWQTNNQQSDIILIGEKRNDEYQDMIFDEPDLIIELKRDKKGLNLSINVPSSDKESITFSNLKKENMRSVLQCIISVL